MHERFQKLGLSKPKTVRHRAIGIVPSVPEPATAEEVNIERLTVDIDNFFLAQCVAKIDMIESVEAFDSCD